MTQRKQNSGTSDFEILFGSLKTISVGTTKKFLRINLARVKFQTDDFIESEAFLHVGLLFVPTGSFPE
jgi:hypothetical protein